MRRERRYTEGQKQLLSIDQSALSDSERDLLRRVLLPRTKYLPQSDEEGRELAKQMLGETGYNALFAMAEEIRKRYGEIECGWTRGNGLWDLYYTVKKDGDALCRFGLRFNMFNLVISFGREECELFERERDIFPRDAVQWIFDTSAIERGRKILMFDITDPRIHPYLFRLLAYKKKPSDTECRK